MSFEKKAKSNVGGLWSGVTDNGVKKVTISIESSAISQFRVDKNGNIKITAFKNSYKTPGDNRPDYSIPPPNNDWQPRTKPQYAAGNIEGQSAAPRAQKVASKYNQDFDDINF